MQLNAIILAAGKGKRMRRPEGSARRMKSQDLPKVLHKLNGKPILSYVLETIREAGISDPVIVIGFHGQKIIDAFPNYRYVWQNEQLGTANAALQAKDLLNNEPGYTFILYGDSPLLSVETLKKIVQEVESQQATIGLSVAQAPDDLGLGVVVTDNNMAIKSITEQKVATADLIRNNLWRNAGSWLVKNDFLWPALTKIKKHPVSGEYYVTDLAHLADLASKLAIAVPVADPAEAIGINTPEHLKQAQTWLRIRARE